jgi:hypothetical protein
MSDPLANERRRFQRIRLERAVQVTSGGTAVDCELVDISLKGALVQPLAPWQPPRGSRAELLILLGDDPSWCIRCAGEVTHLEPGTIGIHIRAMDIASSENLRRLVEFNLGDPALLQRELGAMLDDA